MSYVQIGLSGAPTLLRTVFDSCAAPAFRLCDHDNNL
jgi:hypothetical protein